LVDGDRDRAPGVAAKDERGHRGRHDAVGCCRACVVGYIELLSAQVQPDAKRNVVERADDAGKLRTAGA
jgi:hypothetical protein